LLRCGIYCCVAARFWENPNEKEPEKMIFASVIAQIKGRLARQAEFRRVIGEINALSNADLVDIRADRAEMIHHAYLEIYGNRAP
jgi:hypothetical protein